VPPDVIRAKCAPYRKRGKPWHRSQLQNLPDYDIVRIYGAAYGGIVNYYRMAQDAMSLSLFLSCGDAGFCPGQDGVGEFDGGGGVVPGAVLAGFPDRVGVVPGALDRAGVGTLAARVEVSRAGDLGDDAFEGAPLIRGGKPDR
jgi:hypothetical protein